MTKQSVIQEAIIILIEKNYGEFIGTDAIADELMLQNNKHNLRYCAKRVAASGKIVIIPSRGGRGHKTIYKRNRNQAGQPRRTK